jgi:hypothetical protein
LNLHFTSIQKGLALLRRLSFVVLFGLLVAGCGSPNRDKLGEDDLHFAAFYADYLARSGGAGEEAAAPSTALTGAGLDTLFARHKIDQKTFDARLQAYSRDPELWRKVLQEVRRNLDEQDQ